ncbi:hypothetical protein Hanom_Chr02g00155811 [Helianthus anomalus]
MLPQRENGACYEHPIEHFLEHREKRCGAIEDDLDLFCKLDWGLIVSFLVAELRKKRRR